MLDSSQLKIFRDQGYLVLESFFSPDEVNRIRRAALDIVDNFDIDRHRTVFRTDDRDAGRDEYFFGSAEAVHCFLEDGALSPEGELIKPKALAINKIGHALHDLVPEFSAFCRKPIIGETLRDIGFQAPKLWQTMYIFKQPGIGGEVRWHQDASYLITEPAGVVGIWIAIEDASLENGCLCMQPGQHRSALREIYEVDSARDSALLRTLDKTPWCADDAAVPLEVPAGSAVLFHDHMPHYSSRNHSNQSRHAFIMHVTEADANWSARNWLQRPNLEPFLL